MLQVKNISFKYEKASVLKNISFSVNKGEHLSIIGESGSGKSTLLKLIYGEYDLNNGEIFWNDIKVLGPAYNLVVGYDFMKYVAQEFDLMPFITVQENIGKYLSNFYPEEKQRRIDELLSIVELVAFAKTKVKFLSGGQKQRVALARALAIQPEIMLLDEPFSHIDNFKKQSLRRNLFKYLKDKQITCIVATHDKEDSLSYADNILVLHQGKEIAKGTPKDLFNNPTNPLVASFFGEFNVINNVIVYAHQLRVVEYSDLRVVVKNCYFKGDYYLIEVELSGETVLFKNSTPFENDKQLYLSIVK